MGVGADVDQRHIVEIEASNQQGKKMKHPILSIGAGTHMVSTIFFRLLIILSVKVGGRGQLV